MKLRIPVSRLWPAEFVRAQKTVDRLVKLVPHVATQCDLVARQPRPIAPKTDGVQAGSSGAVRYLASGTVSDPTADAALARLQHPVSPEEREKQLIGFWFGLIDALAGVLAAIQADMPQVASNLDKGRDPLSGLTDAQVASIEAGYRAPVLNDVECWSCKIPSGRILGGMCPQCHDDWVSEGRPDRGEWSAGRNPHPATAASDW